MVDTYMTKELELDVITVSIKAKYSNLELTRFIKV